MPPAQPTTSSRATSSARCHAEGVLPVCTAVSATVRMTAIGSLSPDSSSSVAATRLDSAMRLLRSTAKTAAASVDETMAPSSNASGQEKPRRCAAAGDDARW